MRKHTSRDVLDAISQADVITIFHHVYPDLDAYGSQLGLKAWLEQKFPSKKIYALGQGDQMDAADDETVKNSLAILVDCSTSNRVDDDRWKTAAKTARIDHHVHTEQFCDLEYINEDATATCEMVALMAKEEGDAIHSETAQKLYEGLIADNLRFSVDKVSPASFEAGAYLVANGADVVQAAKNAFASSYQDFTYENAVRSKSKRMGSFLFSVMSASDYLGQGLSFTSAKEKVYALGDIEEIEVWALFTQMEDGIHYSASLRAKTLPVRDIAQEYKGGGHNCAAGIKNLDISQVSEVIEKLYKLAQSKSES